MSSSTSASASYTVTVSRFDPRYPRETPDSFIVGFTISHKTNGRSTYLDARLPYTDTSGMSDNQVVDLAWGRVEPTIQSWLDVASTQSPIVGSAYVPK